MGRVCILAKDSELGEKIIEMFKRTDDMMQISKELNIPYHRVRGFLKSMEKKSLQVISTTKQFAEKSLEQNFDAYNRLIEKIDQIESFVKQLQYIDEITGEEKVNPAKSREFLIAWNSTTDTLKWWVERKIKFLELLQNELFRTSIIEAIENEFPAVAKRIKDIIERKKSELGVI